LEQQLKMFLVVHDRCSLLEEFVVNQVSSIC